MVFDLDPGPPADILQCAEVAELLRELLERLQLRSWVKVSGSKGLQVYVPLNTAVTYSITQPLARSLAQALHQEHRELIVSTMEREQRKGKVFIDWSQNADYKTTVAVYSLRAKRSSARKPAWNGYDGWAICLRRCSRWSSGCRKFLWGNWAGRNMRRRPGEMRVSVRNASCRGRELRRRAGGGGSRCSGKVPAGG